MAKYITATEVRDRIKNPKKYMSEYQKLQYLQRGYQNSKSLQAAIKPLVDQCLKLLKEKGLL